MSWGLGTQSHHGQGCEPRGCLGLQQAAGFQAMGSVSQLCSHVHPGLVLLTGAAKQQEHFSAQSQGQRARHLLCWRISMGTAASWPLLLQKPAASAHELASFARVQVQVLCQQTQPHPPSLPTAHFIDEWSYPPSAASGALI